MQRLNVQVRHSLQAASSLTSQSRGFKDGKRAIILSWHGFKDLRSHGGPESTRQMWTRNGAPPRKPHSYLSVPRGTVRNPPVLDPYKFKYVGVKVDEKGKPIFNGERRLREEQIRHEFRSLLAERNFHGFPLLHWQIPRPHANQWNATNKVKGYYY
ncbi:hypothetical protein DIPPA_07398 [Diplonema papillatum]|nr:hypothetical protein DIPPA_07398 [Diplonema papillatum]